MIFWIFQLTRVGEGFGPQMAEFVMGTLFYFSLRINVMSAQQGNGFWFVGEKDFIRHCVCLIAIKSWDPLTLRDRMQLGGKTMVILGAGNIAGYIAKSAKSFGMRCVGLCSTLKEGDEMKQARTSVFDELSDNIACVSEADVIVNCLPSTPSTRGLLNLRSLSSCSKIPIFINVGRGDVISLPDIESALNRSFISFAILDVFPQEPLDPNDSLWKNPQVLISPHISAVSHPGLVADVFIPNLKRYLQGERLKHVVDLKKGY
jgi:phosphoglycerate dehydrogenase-like enzyme